MLQRLLLCLSIMLFVLSCYMPSRGESPKVDVGILLPTQMVQRWNQDGANMKMLLEDRGHTVDLKYASNKVDIQVAQIEAMLDSQVNVIVIAPVDSEDSLLSDTLDRAKSLGVQVVSYDIFTKNTDAVSYYVTFDSYSVGVLQARYIEDKLDLANGAGPFNIELLTGDLSYNNTPLFFYGAMDILNPYIDKGQLVVKSGKRTIEDASISLWASDVAQEHLKKILNITYKGNERIDVVLCSNDTIAVGAIKALLEAKYTDKNMPIVTGQDCDVRNINHIINGLQSMSVFKDTRELSAITAEIVCDILKDKEPDDINASLVYNNNGVKDVPSYVLEPFIVDISNYKELLVDSGYYNADDLK